MRAWLACEAHAAKCAEKVCRVKVKRGCPTRCMVLIAFSVCTSYMIGTSLAPPPSGEPRNNIDAGITACALIP